ncbi:hypothetical protein L6164_000461 [Bauhinia variegata]|uniref:Uncharacterized protein n=1 Tax=Bauhinia variegata TaxID=167791 RepID=A0ACB9Q813_BAUVA|nr:hypothetical protein L6164_000461 [Bauhinia variegata]
MEESGEQKKRSKGKKDDLFHVLHKVPYGDSPYVKAKHAQLVDKDPEAAVALFWKAINEGDKVESALKDMANVLKQLDRSEEAIEAINSFRSICSKESQESLDNVLIDLYMKCGRTDEQIELIKKRLRLIYQGDAFNGKTTKTARCHGKKLKISIQQETSRLLGKLGWAYMQNKNYMMAEVVQRKAQLLGPDSNRACNLGLCLIKRARFEEAHLVLQDVLQCRIPGSDDDKTRKRAEELVMELKSVLPHPQSMDNFTLDDNFVEELDHLLNAWGPNRSRRLPIFKEISQDQLP